MSIRRHGSGGRITRFSPLFFFFWAGMLIPSGALASDIGGTREELIASFMSGTYQTEGSITLPYRYYSPLKNHQGTKSLYPLILFLHGEDAAGTDNSAQLRTSECATVWVEPDHIAKNPTYVLAPQIAAGHRWVDDDVSVGTIGLLRDFIAHHEDVDIDRIYIVGFSMGATGMWRIVLDNPTLFAAAMSISGDGDAFCNETKRLSLIKNLPIMLIHTKDDPVVPVECSDRIAKALANSGNSSVQVKKWEGGTVVPSHESWYPAFHKYEVVYNWVFLQSLEGTCYGEIAPNKLFTAKFLGDDVTQIWDINGDTAYVIEKTDKALLIDSTMGAGNLYRFIRNRVLKNKTIPIEIAITHWHWDHVMGLPSFVNQDQVKRLYISKEDYNDTVKTYFSNSSKVSFVSEGDTIPLGGGKVNIIAVPGHTMGSLVYHYENNLFLGDAVGSGDLWMSGSELTIEEYITVAQHLRDYIGSNREMGMMVGHTAECRTPLSTQYIDDLIACAKGIVDGTLPIGNYYRRAAACATYGRATIMFDLQSVKAKVAKLSMLSLASPSGNVALSTAFSPEVLTYTASVASYVEKLTIWAMTCSVDKKIAISINSGEATILNYRDSYTCDLKAGVNNIVITVTQGMLSTVYSLSIVRG